MKPGLKSFGEERLRKPGWPPESRLPTYPIIIVIIKQLIEKESPLIAAGNRCELAFDFLHATFFIFLEALDLSLN